MELCKDTREHTWPQRKSSRLKVHATHFCCLRDNHSSEHVCDCGWSWGSKKASLHAPSRSVETHFRVPFEDKASIAKRRSTEKASKEYRQDKRRRLRGGAQEDVNYANSLRALGIDLLSTPRDQVYRSVIEKCEGRRVDKFSPFALEFLRENYDVEQIVDSDGRILLHFIHGGPMSIINDVTERSEQPRKVVKAVYDSLVRVIQKTLKRERKVRLPGIGRIAVKYRPAKPKREGRNPATGEKMMFKAKDASNKLKFRVAKELKDYCDKLPVEEPEKKKKDKKKEKKKSS